MVFKRETRKYESRYKIRVSNLATFLLEAHIRRLLEAFGPLKYFELVHGGGYAFCEYVNGQLVT